MPIPDVPEVTVILPCRNEADSIAAVIDAVPAGFATLVVDNGSTDATAARALRAGAAVVTEPRPGYGHAVHAGVLAARSPIVCTLDGDGSMDPGELAPLIEAVRSGADLAVGRRRAQAGSWPWHARAGSLLIARRLRSRFGVAVHDIGPMRAARRENLLDLGVRDRNSGYPVELLVRAGRAGWTVREFDVTYSRRTAGRSKVSGSLTGSVRATRDFLRCAR
ncbi:glycosyltransferase family 2 protein [Tsukamurella soli]|uniref:Glycosyltransferase family 2 protein n=1 Tax=Tsukamurella soli TaxID=644556 RepID=A0ABP8JNM5_9ACTN